jgi:hypothetical protein
MISNQGSQLQEETLRELADIIRIGNLLLRRAHRISQAINAQVRQAMEDNASKEKQASLEECPAWPNGISARTE